MPKNFNFMFEDMPFCLEYIGNSMEGLDLKERRKDFSYDCNFFRLHYLGEKRKIALSYAERVSKEIFYDSNGQYIDSGKDGITIFDYYYNDRLVNHINDLVNQKILNNEFEAKINVVFPAGRVIDQHMQHIYCPLYNRWINNLGNSVSGTVLPHLIVNEKHIPDNKYKGFAGLREITILDNNETIGANAFADCDCWLRTIRLSNNLVEIGDSAFENTGLEVVKLPKTVKKIGKNAFRKTFLDVLAVYCDIEEIEQQNLLSYVGEGRYAGSYYRRKTIIILYDSNNIRQYTLDYSHWDSLDEKPTKVYRQIDLETGDRLYTRESSSWRTYKNAKKYDSLDENSWHNEINMDKVFKITEMFKNDFKQSDYPKSWIYSRIILVPEQELDRAIDFIVLKNLKDQLISYQETMKKTQQLQQETEQKIAEIEPSLLDFDDFSVKEEKGYYLVMNKKFDKKNKN